MDSIVNIAQPLSFDQLADQILLIDNRTEQAAATSINQLATLRNLLIGAYIVEYEQNDKDRADYEDFLIERI